MAIGQDDIKFNPFDYRAITFLEFLTQIEANDLFKNKPQWLKILLAGRLDIITSYIDARANNSMFHSMYTLENVMNFASYLGYNVQTGEPATGVMQVSLKPSATLPLLVKREDLQFATSESVGGAVVRYVADGDVRFTSLKQNINVMQGELFVDTFSTAATGTPFELLPIERSEVIKSSIEFTIDGDAYAVVDSLLDSHANDKHVRLIRTDEGDFLRGGDGKYGEVFPPGFYPKIKAVYGGGSRGNQGINKVDSYIGGVSEIDSVTNPSPMSGGKGAESIDRIKTYAPLGVVAQERAVSAADFLYFSETFEGASRAYIQPNHFGTGSVKIQVVPNGGGAPSPSLKAKLTAFLKEKTLLSNIFVSVHDPDYQKVDVSIEVQTGAGVEFEDVRDYVKLGVIFLINETTTEFKEVRKSEGIEVLIDNINTIYGFSFRRDDPAVQKQIVGILDAIDPLEWGEDIYEAIFFYMSKTINGVDLIILVSPQNKVVVAKDKAGVIKLPTLGKLTVVSRNLPERNMDDKLVFKIDSLQSMLLDNTGRNSVVFRDTCTHS